MRTAVTAWSAAALLAACGGGAGGADGFQDVGDTDLPPLQDGSAECMGECQDVGDTDLPPLQDGSAECMGECVGGQDELGCAEVDDDCHGSGDVPHPVWGTAGYMRAAENVDQEGKLFGSTVDMRFMSAPTEWGMAIEDEIGPCRYYKSTAAPQCEPGCDRMSEYCAFDGACKPFPHRVSAGEVTIAGLTPGKFTGTPDETNWYTVTEKAGGDLFDPSSKVAVDAKGADIPAFQVELPGVGAMSVPWSLSYELTDGKDNVFDWEVQGDGATVELYIPTGWHGKPPTDVIWCVARDEDGQIPVPHALVENFPPAGGIGLFQHVPWIRRVQRKIVESPYGPIDVYLSSELGFSITHGL